MFSVSNKGKIAYTYSRPTHPADIVTVDSKGGNFKRLTNLNKALFAHKKPGKVEEIWYTSSVDQRKIQGWIVYPPNYSPEKKYPFMVENHGGPILNYGDRFSIEMQLYASARIHRVLPQPKRKYQLWRRIRQFIVEQLPWRRLQ